MIKPKNFFSTLIYGFSKRAFAEYDKFKLVQDRDYLSDFDKEIKRLYEKK